MQDIDCSDFRGQVLDNPRPVLVDYWTSWCGSCKMLAPVLEEVAIDLQGKLDVVKLDVDANMTIAEQYGVKSVPTMILFNNGEEIVRMVGYRSKQELLNQLKELIL